MLGRSLTDQLARETLLAAEGAEKRWQPGGVSRRTRELLHLFWRRTTRLELRRRYMDKKVADNTQMLITEAGQNGFLQTSRMTVEPQRARHAGHQEKLSLRTPQVRVHNHDVGCWRWCGTFVTGEGVHGLDQRLIVRLGPSTKQHKSDKRPRSLSGCALCWIAIF